MEKLSNAVRFTRGVASTEISVKDDPWNLIWIMPAKGSEAVLCRCAAIPSSCNPDDRATAFLLPVAQWFSFRRRYSKKFSAFITGKSGFPYRAFGVPLREG